MTSKGYRVFFDKNNLQIRTNFPSALSTAIKTCNEFISVVTPSYCGEGRNGKSRILERGDWVHEEIRIALNYADKQFFPITIDCAPPQRDSLPSDIATFAEKNFVQYNRSYDTYEKIVERIAPKFSESTRENATIGVISGLLAAMDVNDNRQFNVVCKDISRFMDEATGERALSHILSEKKTESTYMDGITDMLFFIPYFLVCDATIKQLS